MCIFEITISPQLNMWFIRLKATHLYFYYGNVSKGIKTLITPFKHFYLKETDWVGQNTLDDPA